MGPLDRAGRQRKKPASLVVDHGNPVAVKDDQPFGHRMKDRVVVFLNRIDQLGDLVRDAPIIVRHIREGLRRELPGSEFPVVAGSAFVTYELLSFRQETPRRLAALQQNLTRQALLTTSNRFDSLQHLIDAIAAAEDQKAVLDLQARVGAESSMLQNEQSKLLTLFQLVQAEEHTNRQQQRERAVVGHGQFATRFQPVP